MRSQSFCLVVWVVIGVATAGSRAQQPPQDPPTLVDAPGKEVVLRLCNECHDAAARITKVRKTEDEWADLITDMQNRGLRADDKEIDIALTYLSQNYGRPPDASRRQ